jgi:hypothetical protein
MNHSSFYAKRQRAVAATILIAAYSPSTIGTVRAATPARGQTVVQSKFYCNLKAMDPVERQRHKELTEYLIRARKEIVETEKGYEFQFSPPDVSLTQLVEWVTAEAKCCPFFNFHIDLEREGRLVCLGLGGADGIKPFIRTEFQVPEASDTTH